MNYRRRIIPIFWFKTNWLLKKMSLCSILCSRIICRTVRFVSVLFIVNLFAHRINGFSRLWLCIIDSSWLFCLLIFHYLLSLFVSCILISLFYCWVIMFRDNNINICLFLWLLTHNFRFSWTFNFFNFFLLIMIALFLIIMLVIICCT